MDDTTNLSASWIQYNPTFVVIGLVAILCAVSVTATIRHTKQFEAQKSNESSVAPGSPSLVVEEKVNRVLRCIAAVARQGNLDEIRKTLPLGWEVGINVDGELYYVE
jgi:hypothetical protein